MYCEAVRVSLKHLTIHILYFSYLKSAKLTPLRVVGLKADRSTYAMLTNGSTHHDGTVYGFLCTREQDKIYSEHNGHGLGDRGWGLGQKLKRYSFQVC